MRRGPVRDPASVNRGGAPVARAQATLAVDSIGYLVPADDFAGVVHSVFARAVNFACEDNLFTLVGRDAGDGPTTLLLRGGAPPDLRACFEPGAAFACRARMLFSPRAVVSLCSATTWRPAAERTRLSLSRVAANLTVAADRLAQRRTAQPSIIDGLAAPSVAALSQATLSLDLDAASAAAVRLIGWGEGLTPAGDDFLVGYLAGLDAYTDQPARTRFRDALVETIVRRAHLTTDLAAHLLRLSAMHYFTAVLLGARDALLSEERASALEAALADAFAVGATSGLDAASGLIAALRAWSPTMTEAALA